MIQETLLTAEGLKQLQDELEQKKLPKKLRLQEATATSRKTQSMTKL